MQLLDPLVTLPKPEHRRRYEGWRQDYEDRVSDLFRGIVEGPENVKRATEYWMKLITYERSDAPWDKSGDRRREALKRAARETRIADRERRKAAEGSQKFTLQDVEKLRGRLRNARACPPLFWRMSPHPIRARPSPVATALTLDRSPSAMTRWQSIFSWCSQKIQSCLPK